MLGCQLVALWEADGIFGRWDLTEGTWISGNISWRRCWKASLFLCFFAWWTLGTSPSATLTTVMSCLNVGSNVVKRWPQTKPSKLWVKESLSSLHTWFPLIFHHSAGKPTKKNLQKLSLYGLYFLFEYSWAFPKWKLKVTLLLYSSPVSGVLASSQLSLSASFKDLFSHLKLTFLKWGSLLENNNTLSTKELALIKQRLGDIRVMIVYAELYR